MFCKNCGTQLDDNAKFCSVCGTSATSDSSAGSRPESNRRKPQGPNVEAIAEFDRIVARNTKLKRTIAWPIAAVIALWSLFCFSKGSIDGGVLALGFTLVIFFSCLPKSHLSAAQYKALPGSAVRNGKPVCVHCGNAGIYLHGRYKSNTKFHDCSKCGVTLFTS